MFDLYLFNTIMNTLWYLFTVLFVLYKYTTFFNYIYNFVKFCGKLITGISHVYKYINPSPQIDLEAQYLQENERKSLYTKCKGYIVKNYNYYYRKIFKNEYNEPLLNRNNQNTFPLIETDYGSKIQFSTQLHKSNDTFPTSSTRSTRSTSKSISKKYEIDMFNKKMNELDHSELELEENKCLINNDYYYNKLDGVVFNIKDASQSNYNNSNNFNIKDNLNVFYSNTDTEDTDIDKNIDTDIDKNIDIDIDKNIDIDI